jgi:hypothetical protein
MLRKIANQECPVCGGLTASPFFGPDDIPLSTLGWPKSEAEALAMDRLPHNFFQCCQCTHVWNIDFKYEMVPYQKEPNLMFNKGGNWTGHLDEIRRLIIESLPANPTIVEIGCGDGSFLSGIAAELNFKGTFIGFDPGTKAQFEGDIKIISDYFIPEKHFDHYRPDLIIIRHVMEHLTSPRQMAAELKHFAENFSACKLFVETPCIDKVFQTNRVSDFFYEHVSHFTTESFRALLGNSGSIRTLSHGYGGEVIYGLVDLGLNSLESENMKRSTLFLDNSFKNHKTILKEIKNLSDKYQSVVVWGGSGKAAFFINHFLLDRYRFPLVVDSDLSKVGMHVPGMGQTITASDYLRNRVVEIIIIPMQWRAKDILNEIQELNIKYESILIEHNGHLIDFKLDDHPYH